jgi:glycine hydroxymethyltransferase
MHVVAAKAICFGECLQPAFKQYGQQVIDNARVLGEVLAAGGITLVSGGTDNHLLLADVTALGSTGRTAETVLERCGITVNKNMIPFDQRKPMDPSGIRVGTPALTTRGMGIEEMKTIGQWMVDVLKAPEDEALIAKIRADVSEMCKQFPVPSDR